jgi:hypothetical protein
MRNQRSLNQRRQIDKPDPARECRHKLCGTRDSEARLPTAADTGERHQSMCGKQMPDLGHFVGPTNKAAECMWQIIDTLFHQMPPPSRVFNIVIFLTS